MTWIFYALWGAFVASISNFFDKYIVSHAIKDYRGVPVYGTITAFIVGTIFWFVTGQPSLSLTDALIVIGSGALTIFAAPIYYRVMTLEDASKVVFLFQSTPVFTLILSSIFLKENISTAQILGFVLILSAAMAISMEKGKSMFKLSKSFWLMIICNIIWASSIILIKFAINATSFNVILSYESWGLALGGTILYLTSPGIRKAFNESITTLPRKLISIMFLNEIIWVCAKALVFFSYTQGPAILVNVLGSTQVLWSTVFGLGLTMFLPKLFNENIAKETLLRKLICACLILIGIYLVQ